MGRTKRFIKKLTEEQKSSLEKGYRSGKSHLYRRKCQSILLSAAGSTVQELSLLYGVTSRTIYTWFTLWESKGIKALELQPGRGRPLKLSEDNQEQVNTIKKLIENEPKNLKKVLLQIQSELGIDLSKKTLKRFLKNLNTNGSDFVNDSKANQIQ